MLDSEIKIYPPSVFQEDPTIDELLTTLNCLEATQCLEIQRLRLLIDRSMEDSRPAVTGTRHPDIAFSWPRAA